MSNITERGIRMHNPPHPGEILKELYLSPLGLTVTEAAAAIRVSRTALSTVVNGRARISVEMATRLAKAFRTGVEFWLRLQLAHDVWQVERTKDRVHVRPLVKKRAVGA